MEVEEIFIDGDITENTKDSNILDKYTVKNQWEWDVFGNGDVIFALPNNISFLKRFGMSRLFGSRWKKI